MAARFAAQYIRMSSDKQDLSPAVQKEAIAAYAAAHAMEVVATYEDDGRSGVYLDNRPALVRLLRDVTEPDVRFSGVLVYDVSRWGRFQDTDAAAYHEYHCRLHGVEVIYVAELFGAEVNTMTAMFKSMKRVMAADYSRDLATKCRAGQHLVVSRGYQMGPLPPLGYRRCSVSADGQRRVVLIPGQRKFAATDRIEWILAEQEEVDLVRRICGLYARTKLTFAEISRLGAAEGWRDHQGRQMNRSGIATLVRNEALIGNFVWGRRAKHKRSLINCRPSRQDGSVPRLIDDDTWARIQDRTALELAKKKSDEEIVAKLKQALERSPMLTTRDLRAQGLPSKVTLRRRFGTWPQCLEQAGRVPTELSKALFERANERKQDTRDFGSALAKRLGEEGHVVAFDGRLNILALPGIKMRLRLLWPMPGELGQMWRIRVEGVSRDVDFDLLVRMEERFRAKDFFIVPPADVVARLPQWLTGEISPEFARFWCRSPKQLLERIRAANARSAKVTRYERRDASTQPR